MNPNVLVATMAGNPTIMSMAQDEAELERPYDFTEAGDDDWSA